METGYEIVNLLETLHINKKNIKSAIRRCYQIRYETVVPQIFEIAKQKNVRLDLNILKLVLSKSNIATRRQVFDDWFIRKKDRTLIPDVLLMNKMIAGYAKAGDYKQALYFFRLLIEKFHLDPNAMTCNSMLLACLKTCDMESAEVIWDSLQQDPNIKIDHHLLNSILRVYSYNCKIKQMMDLLNYFQQPDHFIKISNTTCEIIAKTLAENNIQELINFYKQLPTLNEANALKVGNLKMLEWLCFGHLNALKRLNERETEQITYRQQQFLDIFNNEFPEDVKKNFAYNRRCAMVLVECYVLSNKNWINVVTDFERVLAQNQTNFFEYRNIKIIDKRKQYLNFGVMPNTIRMFLLRYLMTFRRDEVKQKFEDGKIMITCLPFHEFSKINEKKIHQKLDNTLFKNELNQWKIPIRVEQDPSIPALFYLNQEDVSLFFQTVPPGNDCLKAM
ncbi:hypothetical protein RFI_14587 [Reticulomyxa filosa]|uniref:Pentatricopeptide repeat-containing protein n=1 Tax=Reticulomyxa filosa TaxID=46433 RepID=X6NBB0_RETFI|nr:hypothetical protein RFI_14587 [Reticulomyxa filosa]|eukprot:ETO22607.1 hypothetical protein RFI_14587 [Reticulomyxa filosa]